MPAAVLKAAFELAVGEAFRRKNWVGQFGNEEIKVHHPLAILKHFRACKTQGLVIVGFKQHPQVGHSPSQETGKSGSVI